MRVTFDLTVGRKYGIMLLSRSKTRHSLTPSAHSPPTSPHLHKHQAYSCDVSSVADPRVSLSLSIQSLSPLPHSAPVHLHFQLPLPLPTCPTKLIPSAWHMLISPFPGKSLSLLLPQLLFTLFPVLRVSEKTRRMSTQRSRATGCGISASSHCLGSIERRSQSPSVANMTDPSGSPSSVNQSCSS